MPREQRDALIDRLAAAQHGVVTRDQLVRGGSRGTVERRMRNGRLTAVFRGVYRVGPVVSVRAREMAALLACGPAAVLSHRTAAAVWELLPGDAAALVEVTMPERMRRRIPGIIAHRCSTLDLTATAMRDGLRLTTAPRTLLDLAGILASGELERVVALADRTGLASPAEVLALAGSCRRHPGGLRLRTLLGCDEAPAFTRSEAEKRLLDLIRRARLTRPQLNARLCGYEVDFVWSNARLVAEVDGYAYHRSTAAFAGDRRRDAALTAAGFRVVRLTWADITKHSEATVAVLASALARG